jgi:hypothetical protein
MLFYQTRQMQRAAQIRRPAPTNTTSISNFLVPSESPRLPDKVGATQSSHAQCEASVTPRKK